MDNYQRYEMNKISGGGNDSGCFFSLCKIIVVVGAIYFVLQIFGVVSH